MNWFTDLLGPKKLGESDKRKKKGVPEGLWSKCPACDAILYRADLEKNLEVCPKCDHHIRIGARKRLGWFLDPEGREEIAEKLEPTDPLKFRDTKKYKDRISAAQKKTGEKDALIAMRGQLCGMPIVAASFEFAFLGGSMGTVVGERFVQAVNTSIAIKAPFVCFTSSGGARMQEAILSLMQMAKTSAALSKLSEKGLPFISVLTDPTTGGVSASLATLGDIIIAEPKALIGFAGPRVIEQTVRETLPEGFQRSEFLLEHGAIDMIVDRRDLRPKIAHLLAKLTGEKQPEVDVVEKPSQTEAE